MLAFLGGPLRSQESRSYLECLERVIVEAGFEVWVPHKGIGVMPRYSKNVTPLQQNFDALRRCRIAVFVLDSERTGTGIELGFLYSLRECGSSSSPIVGVLREGETTSLDLMAKLCIDRHGVLVHGPEGLRNILNELRPTLS